MSGVLWHAPRMSRADGTHVVTRLPEWPAGTVVILVTGGGDPHAIPVSAAIRAGDRRVLLGLARSRDSLARLRRDPRVALSITAGGDVAVTVYGSATVLDEQLTEAVAAVEVAVERVQDHNRPTFEIEAGVAWRWTDQTAARRDEETRAALTRLASAV
jgi:nitroimidazol reductase NimA-like FMN-containing flavoprotein (pyridoxamine 5'-phosphate oxidase superfamily)